MCIDTIIGMYVAMTTRLLCLRACRGATNIAEWKYDRLAKLSEHLLWRDTNHTSQARTVSYTCGTFTSSLWCARSRRRICQQAEALDCSLMCVFISGRATSCKKI